MEIPAATDHVKEMIQIIKILPKRGFAYEVNGSVYFDLSKFPKWGALSGNKLEDLQAGARVEIKEEKRHPSDFALWIENPKHVMQWKAPWSRVAGYPGWHIECSAMSMKYLGEMIDIHTGGEDNKFPHHESEIAQSESSTGNPFARYWLHTKHLLVDGKKMSKSLGNFYTLADLEKKGFDPREVRYLLISTHYRDEMNFTLDGLRAAGEALNRLDEFAAKLAAVAKDRKRKADTPAAPEEVIARARTDFQAAMDDDLNVSKALAGVFSFVKKLNSLLARQNFSSRDARLALVFLQECGGVFGFNFGEKEVEEIPPEVKKLVQEREEARVAKDWKRADELREKIGKLDTRLRMFRRVEDKRRIRVERTAWAPIASWRGLWIFGRRGTTEWIVLLFRQNGFSTAARCSITSGYRMPIFAEIALGVAGHDKFWPAVGW